MQESHPVAPCSRARLVVDELEACTGQAHELGLEIGGAKGEVVETGPVAGKETPHRGIGSEWLEELDRAYERDPDPLRREGLGRGRPDEPARDSWSAVASSKEGTAMATWSRTSVAMRGTWVEVGDAL